MVMRVVFMGTPDFAVPALQALAEAQYEVAAVVTQPDRPRGRGKKEMAPPVKETAEALRIPVLQPLKIKDPDFIRLLNNLAPDVIVVVAFGRTCAGYPELRNTAVLHPCVACPKTAAQLLSRASLTGKSHRSHHVMEKVWIPVYILVRLCRYMRKITGASMTAGFRDRAANQKFKPDQQRASAQEHPDRESSYRPCCCCRREDIMGKAGPLYL